MTKTPKASDYTNSPWSGKKYGTAQTIESLTAESKKVLNAHPTIGKMLRKPMTAEELRNIVLNRR